MEDKAEKKQRRKKMSEVLVIDSRNRRLHTFVASVTKVQENPRQLVLRDALDMGSIWRFVESKDEDKEKIVLGMDVLLMGEYEARSSEGHVSVFSKENNRNRPSYIVGGLGEAFGKGGLKILSKPISTFLVRAPLEVRKVRTASNSNTSTSNAGWRGMELLFSIVDREATFLVEGQSDYKRVIRFRPLSDSSIANMNFPSEHQEMFSEENIFWKMVYRTLCDGNDGDVPVPSNEEVKAVAEQSISYYLMSSWEERNVHPFSYYFELLGSDKAIISMAEKLRAV